MKFLKNLQERTYHVLVFSRDFMDVDVVMVAVVVQKFSANHPTFYGSSRLEHCLNVEYTEVSSHHSYPRKSFNLLI